MKGLSFLDEGGPGYPQFADSQPIYSRNTDSNVHLIRVARTVTGCDTLSHAGDCAMLVRHTDEGERDLEVYEREKIEEWARETINALPVDSVSRRRKILRRALAILDQQPCQRENLIERAARLTLNGYWTFALLSVHLCFEVAAAFLPPAGR
jgi:hypothetical protein